MTNRKTVDIRCRVDADIKEKWIALCDIHSWNGSDKIRKYIEQLILQDIYEIENYLELKRKMNRE